MVCATFGRNPHVASFLQGVLGVSTREGSLMILIFWYHGFLALLFQIVMCNIATSKSRNGNHFTISTDHVWLLPLFSPCESELVRACLLLPPSPGNRSRDHFLRLRYSGRNSWRMLRLAGTDLLGIIIGHFVTRFKIKLRLFSICSAQDPHARPTVPSASNCVTLFRCPSSTNLRFTFLPFSFGNPRSTVPATVDLRQFASTQSSRVVTNTLPFPILAIAPIPDVD